MTLSSVTMAAKYFKPDESTEIFRLEKIPLQLDSMKELSKHLVTLALREQDKSPAQRRATGQLLALAMRLDPTNHDALETNKMLSIGNEPEWSPEPKVIKSKARLRFFTRWLASPGAGADANLLAKYLTDATRVLHPETINAPDKANWTGVIPPLDKYRGGSGRPKPPTDDRKPDGENMDNGDKGDETPGTPPSNSSSKFHITDLKVKIPAQLQAYEKYRDHNTNQEKTKIVSKYIVSEVNLHLVPRKDEEPFIISFKTKMESPWSKDQPSLTRESTNIIHKSITRHAPLPPQNAEITISGGTYAKFNRHLITAPVALMLEASLANKPLRQDIHICAAIDESGKLVPPANLWTQLSTLRKYPKGGRLIVAQKDSALLAQILVYGEPDFFTRWEVITAADIQDALLVAGKDTTEDHAEADELFASIQKLTRTSDVTKLAVNRAVRTRLGEILKLRPDHLSAKILLLQGSGKRPMRLNEKALAHELLPVVAKMNRALTGGIDINDPSSKECKKIHENARKQLALFERLVDHSEDDLFKGAINLANDFRRLSTIAKRLSSDTLSESDKKKARSLFYTMQSESQTLLDKILVDAGLKTKGVIKAP